MGIRRIEKIRREEIRSVVKQRSEIEMFRICTLIVRGRCCGGKMIDGTEWTLKEMETKPGAVRYIKRTLRRK